MKDREYELICIDIDGTLARNDKSISNKNIEALQKVHQLGKKIVLASGRSLVSLQSISKTLALPAYSICLNGAYIVLQEEIIASYSFTKEQIEILLSIILDNQVMATFSTPKISIRNHDVSKEWKKQIEEGSLKADYIVAPSLKEYQKYIRKYQEEIVKISILEKDIKNIKKLE